MGQLNELQSIQVRGIQDLSVGNPVVFTIISERVGIGYQMEEQKTKMW
jgi:hypothetical protein